MKSLTQLFALATLVILFTTSCSEKNNTQVALSSDIDVSSASITRASQAGAFKVKFGSNMITIESGDYLGFAQNNQAENDDAQVVMNINQALMGTEKEAQVLDVNFTMSDEPVQNGMFIFGIETENGKDLTLEMFDEEGYAMVANNKFQINQGSNYKALNVQSLENGTYNFRIKDDAGKELNKQVVVSAEYQ